MTSWATLPALRLALALAGGIALAGALPAAAVAPLGAGSLVVAAIALAVPTTLAARARVRGAGVLLASAALGVWLGRVSAPEVVPPPEGDVAYLVAEVERVTAAGGDAWAKADVRLRSVRVAGSWAPASTRVRLVLEPGLAGDSVGAGAVVLSSARLEEVDGPLNPGAFDYRAYLARQGIGHHAFVRTDGLRVLRPSAPPSAVARFRADVAARLDAAAPDPAVAGVARALVLGDRGGLDDATRDDYVRTGAVHVLAVSGLHTGVIAGLLLWLLAPLRRRGASGRVGALVALWVGLAAYAWVTGFAPSVRRSALMFGVLFAGTTLREEGNPLNSLGLSALLLLLLDPQLVFELGFQLSYVAVAGILAFHPPLKRWLRSGNRVVAFGADLLAVSLAATAATAPLTIYHFHQFPLAFALSGMIAVPLVATALPLLLGGLALDYALAAVGLGGVWALAPGATAVAVCNGALRALASVPGVLAEALWPSVGTSVAALSAVALAGAFALRRTRRLALAAAAAFCLAGASNAVDVGRKRAHRSVTTYGLRDAVVTDLIAAGTYRELASGSAPLHRIRREVAPNRHRLGLRTQIGGPAYEIAAGSRSGVRAFAAAGRRWLVLPATGAPLPGGSPAVDWVVVTDVRHADAHRLGEVFPGAKILASGTPPPWRRDAWEGLRDVLHVLPEDGAFVAAVGAPGG